MASSRKRRPHDLALRIERELVAHVEPHARLTLGLSGGIDSVVLLDVLAALAPRVPFALATLHVNHHISPNASRWARFARQLAARYDVPCAIRSVDLGEHPGLGLEGAARAARYAAFARARADFVVLAQHQDDQAETVLLQLVRGAGVQGLAAMPVVRLLDGRGKAPALLRPMLGIARAEIEAYARAHELEWVDDESNADVGLARNFVRHRVLPVLQEINTAAIANIARSATHLAEAVELLESVAQMDAATIVAAGAIDLAGLRAIGGARARNLLRWLLVRSGEAPPSTAELGEILRQLLGAQDDAQVALKVGARVLRRYRGHAWLLPERPAAPAGYSARWSGEREWPLAELGGCLTFEPSTGCGVAARAMTPGMTTVRLRRGGERLRPDANRPRRALKNLLQEQGVPPWVRERLPLVYCGDVLACVPGIGVDVSVRAGAGEPGFAVHWRPLA